MINRISAHMALAADQKERIILAVEDLGGLVSASDVALNTGMPLALVTRGLQQIACDASCNMLVSEQGEVCFKFPQNLAEIYVAKDKALQFTRYRRIGQDIVFFLARIIFAFTLLYAIWLFRPAASARAMFWYVLIIFGGIWLEKGDNQWREKDQIQRQDKWMSFTDAIGFGNLANIFSWRYRHRHRKIEDIWELLKVEEESRYSRASFFNVCFSFVFGDGNPNNRFDELQWHVVAEVIRQNKGAVIVEQLSPYLCCPPDDEDSMLPVLVRFGGQPQVADNGTIVYLFPELMKSKGTSLTMPLFLTERNWKFSELPFTYIAPVWFVSTLMLLVSYFCSLHPDLNSLHPDFFTTWFCNFLPEGFYNWHFVLPFSLFFLLVPAGRFIAVWTHNSELDERNRLRAYFAEMVVKPESELAAKLTLRKQYELEENLDDRGGRAAYSTERDVLEQDLDPYQKPIVNWHGQPEN